MTDRPTAEAIRALQELRGAVGRETDDAASSIAGGIEAVTGALRCVPSINVTREIDEIGHLGLTMVDRLRDSAREVAQVIDREIVDLQHLLRDDAGGSPPGSAASASTITQPPQFFNSAPDKLGAELSRAERLSVRPVKVGDAEFDEVINAGELKWAVLPDGELYVMRKHVDGEDDDLAHTALTRGGPVIAAGEANIAGSVDAGYLGLMISNHSGHYEPPPYTLDIGLAAFADAGIHFAKEGQERKYG